MAITSDGLKDLRQHIETTWTHIEVRDESNNPIVRIPNTDPRFTVLDDYVINPITLQLLLTGSDIDIGVGRKVKSYSIYNVAVGGVSLIDVTLASEFTFATVSDTLTIKETINIPAV